MNPISLLITHDSHVVDANNPIGRHVGCEGADAGADRH